MAIDPARIAAAALQARVASHAAARGQARPPAAVPTRVIVSDGSVTQRVQAIPRDDPQRRRKALGVFLESLFLREFGAQLVHDPAFPGLVQAVQQQMEADEALRLACNAFTDLLLAGQVPA